MDPGQGERKKDKSNRTPRQEDTNYRRLKYYVISFGGCARAYLAERESWEEGVCACARRRKMMIWCELSALRKRSTRFTDPPASALS